MAEIVIHQRRIAYPAFRGKLGRNSTIGVFNFLQGARQYHIGGRASEQQGRRILLSRSADVVLRRETDA